MAKIDPKPKSPPARNPNDPRYWDERDLEYELERTVATVRSRYGHTGLRVTMVVPTFHRRTRMAEEVLDALRRRFPKEIAHTVVGFHVKIDEAQSRGQSVFEYAPKDRGAQVLAALAQELETRAPVHELAP